MPLKLPARGKDSNKENRFERGVGGAQNREIMISIASSIGKDNSDVNDIRDELRLNVKEM